jgi:hypothetical protein
VTLADFIVGRAFWCGDQQYRRVDRVEVAGNTPEMRRSLSRDEAEAGGWFNGPPYAVAEHVFDEYDQEGCSLSPED